MSDSGSTRERDPFDRLAESFLARFRAGERPSIEEYVARYPDLANEIRELLPALVELEENLAPGTAAARPRVDSPDPETAPGPAPRQLGDYLILREVGRGGMGVVYEAEQVALGRHVALKVLPRQFRQDGRAKLRFEREAKAAAKLHHTNIVPVFGVGEHDGLRYYAMQFIHGLGLDLVLDELKRLQPAAGRTDVPPNAAGREPRESKAGVSTAHLARSLLSGEFALAAEPKANRTPTESASAGRASRVPVGDTLPAQPLDMGRGSQPGSPASSSSMLPGISAARQSGKRPPTYWQSVARIGVQVSEALDHAHQQGVLHRDVKPSNLLLDSAGTVWVTDFGLAKVDDQPNLTDTGDVLGTLRYMPPEAFDGRVDQRGDVYSLGLTLFEMLAMRPAFEERERHQLVRRVTIGEPPRLDELNREIPRDLVTIVHKAIDREASRRYPTAASLRDDLRRFLADEPIHARRASVPERLGRWCRRNPGVASLSAALVAAFLTGFAGIAWKWREAERQGGIARTAQKLEATQRELAVEQADRATAEADRFRRLLYDTELSLAQQAFDAGDTGRALALLDKQQPRDGQKDLRGFEWRYLKARCRDGSRLTLRGHHADVSTVVFTPDGKTLFTGASGDPTVRMWDLNSQRYVKLLGPQGSPFALSPDGRALALSDNKSLRFWDVAGRRVIASLSQPDYPGSVSYSPDGKLVATCFFDRTIRLWDLAARREVGVLVGHDGPAQQAVFSPDGKTLVSAGRDTTVRLWDVASGREVRIFKGHTDWVRSVAVSPDGKMLASVSDDTHVRLWDAASGQTVKVLRSHGTNLTSVAFSPDGATLATGGGEGTIRLWDAGTWELKSLLRGHTMPVTAVAFAPDGRSLAAGSRDGTVKVWDIGAARGPDVLSGHDAAVAAMAVSPDGKTLAVSVADERDNVIKLWDLASRRPVGDLRGHSRPAWGVRFAPDGRTVATAGSDMTARVWDVATREQLLEFQLPDRAFTVEFSPDGKLLAVGLYAPRTLLIWDLTTRREVKRLESALRARFSPNGRLLATAGLSEVRLWNVATWREVAVLEGRQSELLGLAFSPDGRTLATRDVGGTLWLWDLARREAVGRKGHAGSTPPSAYGDVEFSPDGQRLATSGGDCTVKLWDVGLLQEVATLTGHEGPVNGLGFMPDGNTLATASSDTTVRLWHAPPLADVVREPAEAPNLPPLETVRLFAFQLMVMGTAQASHTPEGDATRVDIAAVDDTDWHVQLYQFFDELHEGATYRVRFRARADAPGSFQLGAQVVMPYHPIGLSVDVALSDGWRDYEYEFQARQIAAINMLVFNLGRRTGTVWIADFSFTEVAK